MQTSPKVLAIVGTDHHRFDRLVRWVDAWSRDAGVPTLIQFGTSQSPEHAVGRPVIPGDELAPLLSSAVAVVCHGGPGTIVGVREAGLTPIVVPRRPELGEHVDDHQVLFAGRLASEGRIILAASEAELRGHLDRAIADPADLRLNAASETGVEESVRRFSRLVDLLTGRESGVRVPGPPDSDV
jgi:UDP-N-acetylglucosamine transferase subunit ALG13